LNRFLTLVAPVPVDLQRVIAANNGIKRYKISFSDQHIFLHGIRMPLEEGEKRISNLSSPVIAKFDLAEQAAFKPRFRAQGEKVATGWSSSYSTYSSSLVIETTLDSCGDIQLRTGSKNAIGRASEASKAALGGRKLLRMASAAHGVWRAASHFAACELQFSQIATQVMDIWNTFPEMDGKVYDLKLMENANVYFLILYLDSSRYASETLKPAMSIKHRRKDLKH
jgi:hypothetical protein